MLVEIVGHQALSICCLLVPSFLASRCQHRAQALRDPVGSDQAHLCDGRPKGSRFDPWTKKFCQVPHAKARCVFLLPLGMDLFGICAGILGQVFHCLPRIEKRNRSPQLIPKSRFRVSLCSFVSWEDGIGATICSCITIAKFMFNFAGWFLFENLWRSSFRNFLFSFAAFSLQLSLGRLLNCGAVDWAVASLSRGRPCPWSDVQIGSPWLLHLLMPLGREEVAVKTEGRCATAP